MERLTSYDENKGLLVNEEERLLSSKGFIDKLEMYKIMRHLAEKVKEYEDLEEQKRLKIFPCTVGDTVYVLTKCEDILPQIDRTFINSDREPQSEAEYHCPYEYDCPFKDKDFKDCESYKKRTAVFEDTVNQISIFKDDDVHIFTENCATLGMFGKDIFPTKEAAGLRLLVDAEHDDQDAKKHDQEQEEC